MAKEPQEFPFLPKSTAYLKPGMIWDIRLRDGSFACGLVLQVEGPLRARSRFDFWGALLRWHGSIRPTIESISGAPVLWQGQFDVRSLGSSGSQVRGILPLEADGLVIPPMLTTLLNGEVVVGYETKMTATDEQFRTLPVRNLGEDNDSFRVKAEAVFLEGRTAACERPSNDNAILESLGMSSPGDLERVEAEAAAAWSESRPSRNRKAKK